MARPISAPYSSCRLRIESGEPSKPDRLASTTTGRLPLAALIARAVFFDERGNSVPAVQMSGPSLGGKPRRGIGRDSMPIRQTGRPPRWASKTTDMSASAIPAQRSSTCVVLVGHRPHQRPDIERLLPIGVAGRGEDVADRAELAVGQLVRVAGDVAVIGSTLWPVRGADSPGAM